MQKEIVMPKSINGKPVTSVGYYKFGAFKNYTPSKMFIPDVNYPYVYPNGAYKTQPSYGFAKADKLIFLGIYPGDYSFGFYSLKEDLWNTPYKSAIIYVPENAIEEYEEYYANCQEAVFVEANVSYLYNYEQAPNGGYCWIDSLNLGEQVLTLPESPVREGYVFKGWYKDADCIDFVDLSSFTMSRHSIEFYAGWETA